MRILAFSAILLGICEVSLGSVLDSEWIGKMFPEIKTLEQVTTKNNDNMEQDSFGRIKMGIKNSLCDDAVDPKGIDGDINPKTYLCVEEKSFYKPNANVHPKLNVDHIPKGYIAQHHCMNESIEYGEPLPTFGPHRPLWAKYGEYSYLPKQRWVHNLEHGSIVMLHHPCADLNEVEKLKKIVKNCLYQYVISASNDLTAKWPLALIAWGARIEMSMVQEEIVVDFMRSRAFKGPEFTSREGQYDINLIRLASIRLKGEEKNICPDN